jgi:hypothetical protein
MLLTHQRKKLGLIFRNCSIAVAAVIAALVIGSSAPRADLLDWLSNLVVDDSAREPGEAALSEWRCHQMLL